MQLLTCMCQCLKWSKKEAGSLPQAEVECPLPIFFNFWSENGEFWCILGGILCDLELQESKQETRYRPGKSNGAGSPTLATRPHFKPWLCSPNNIEYEYEKGSKRQVCRHAWLLHWTPQLYLHQTLKHKSLKKAAPRRNHLSLIIMT